MINITLPDGSIRHYDGPVSSLDVALSISEGLARNVLVAKVNNEIWDLNRIITTDATLHLLKWDDTEGKYTFWHSSAHLMAEAIETLFPGTKFGIGPAIETGFYYDIDVGDRKLTEEDLQAIEIKMKELASNNSSFIRSEVNKSDALNHFTKKEDQYKLELLQDLEDGSITFYQQGTFIDLCRGPHLPHTGYIKAIKLINIAGAYWRGNEKNKMLTRIYGITFPKQRELDEYLTIIEEARKRDHRRLGQELELFSFSEKVGAGLPLWLPKGTMVREELANFLKKEQLKSGYLPVITPHIGKKDLYVTSGHWEKYGQDSFHPITTPHEGEEYLIKPMNCPHHCEIYKTKQRSYRDLPLRLAEFGTVYRYEQSGELHGLTRVRCFTQDDAHLFCTSDQLKNEFKKVIALTMLVINKLGFKNFTAQVSLRDPDNTSKYIGSDENWIKAESAIIEAAAEMGLPTTIKTGEAAFYGPKLDFMVKDAIGRPWQLGTIQVDYNLPERFELEYIGADNRRHRPVMIHRAPFGSLERMLGVLLEHCGGNLPLWLMPEQVIVLPISEKYHDYAQSLKNQLALDDIRAVIDERAEKIGKKIRDAELSKIPFMLIVGEKEATENQIAVRRHSEGDKGTMSIAEFIIHFHEEAKT